MASTQLKFASSTGRILLFLVMLSTIPARSSAQIDGKDIPKSVRVRKILVPKILRADYSKPDLQDTFSPDLETWAAPADMQKEYPYYLSGFDQDNRPGNQCN